MKLARPQVRRLEREGIHWATAFAEKTRAALWLASDRRDEGLACLKRAERIFCDLQYGLHLAATRYVAGLLRGGAEGKTQADAAEAWMREQTVRNPERMAKFLVPGILP